MMDIETLELKEIAKEIRKGLVILHNKSHTSHIGSDMSIVDILTALYFRVMNVNPENPKWEGRDRFVLSKGHAVLSLYLALQKRGYLDNGIVNQFGEDGTHLFEHPDRLLVPGIDATTGSLGHGLPISIGMALSAKLENLKYRVFVLLSDGECQEGTVWEAVMNAPRFRLDNLVCIVDYNNLQNYEVTEKIQGKDAILKRFEASGWACREVDGHDMDALLELFSEIPLAEGKPTLVLANTIKGKGIQKIENRLEWHYKSPSDEEVPIFLKELDGK